MSTEDQNRCVVTVKKGVDIDALMQEITSLGGTTPYVPQRSVEMWNEKQDSLYNFDVILTKQEANTLKQDSRIIDVRYGSKEENGIFLRRNAIETSRTYSRSTAQNNAHYAWAIPACSSDVNPFTSLNLTYQRPYTAVGKNVDVVIQDSGIQVGHPEWLDQAGAVDRLQQINWPALSGLGGLYTQGPLHYTDTYGHGTHCAGTAAGRRYGWAKEANIYAIKIFDDDAFGISASFNLIREWHNAKSNNNPTIVNQSWGYFSTYTDIIGGSYRGTPWTGTAANPTYGMMETIYNFNSLSNSYTHPIRVASVDADIAACVDAGIILVAAAGNDTHLMDVESGPDYNNFYTTTTGDRYYHRGSTPNGPRGVITVGAVRAANTEYKSNFSTTGPGITVYAPGEAVQSAMPLAADLGTGAVSHPDNNAFYIKKIQGTSMAAPQVTGVLACILEGRKHYTSEECKQWIISTSTKDRLANTGGGYADTQSLQGSANRYLRWPYSSQYPLIVNRT
jgi:subtilisin family serine protease